MKRNLHLSLVGLGRDMASYEIWGGNSILGDMNYCHVQPTTPTTDDEGFCSDVSGFSPSPRSIKRDGFGLTCKVCDQRFKKSSSLWTHTQSHLVEIPSPSTVDESESELETSDEYRLIIDEDKDLSCSSESDQVKVKTLERPFECPTCGKNFRRKTNLNQHLLIHTLDRPFSCKTCPSTFKSKWELKVHLIAHSDARPFVCVTCLKTFKRLASLRDHQSVHSEERPFNCFCGKSFKSKNYLRKHEKVHRSIGCPHSFLDVQLSDTAME